MVRSNYMMTASGFRANILSPETPSISLIIYYQNARRFYEYRLTQIADSRDLGEGLDVNTGWDKRVRHEIWKWNGSNTPLLIASYQSTSAGTDNTHDLKLTETFDLVFRASSDAAGTALAVKFKNMTTDLPFTAHNGAMMNGTSVVDVNSPIRFGSYGFHSADCTVFFPLMSLNSSGSNASPGIGTPEVVIGVGSANHAAEWYYPTELYTISGLQFVSASQSTSVLLTAPSEL